MQPLINGIVAGLGIALLAIAFQMVNLPARVFYIGLAGIYALAPYLYVAMQPIGAPWFVIVLVVACLTAALSAAFEAASHGPLQRSGASAGAHLIASLGMFVVVVQVIALVWGDQPRVLRTAPLGSFPFMGAIVTSSQLVILAAGCVVVGIFVTAMRMSRLALRLRALAENTLLLALFGYNISTVRLAAFAVAGFVAAVASLLAAYDKGFDPHTGINALLLAVVAVIVGGRMSFWGPILGGLIVGTVRHQVAWHFSAKWQDAATLALLAAFLLLRPEGVIGHRTRLEASAA